MILACTSWSPSTIEGSQRELRQGLEVETMSHTWLFVWILGSEHGLVFFPLSHPHNPCSSLTLLSLTAAVRTWALSCHRQCGLLLVLAVSSSLLLTCMFLCVFLTHKCIFSSLIKYLQRAPVPKRGTDTRPARQFPKLRTLTSGQPKSPPFRTVL